MKYKNYEAYDDDGFFEKYIQKRSKGKAPNELIEKPIIDELLGDVKGQRILDLGCGDGSYGTELLDRGVKHYLGIEGSHNMLALARQHLQGYSVDLVQQDLENIQLEAAAYDIVLSRLVLHYIDDLGPLLAQVERSLREKGIFVFSIEHPIITSCYDAYHASPKRGSWVVDNYFSSGERTNIWLGKEVVKYHKTIEEYWRLLKNANFNIAEIRESKPVATNFSEEAEFIRRSRIPLFLMFKVEKK